MRWEWIRVMDPRKTFVCRTCGYEVNDTQRDCGSETPCPNCEQEKLREELAKAKKKPTALERLKEMVNNNQIRIDPVMDDRMKDLMEMADMPIRIGGPSRREPVLYCGHKIDEEDKK